MYSVLSLDSYGRVFPSISFCINLFVRAEILSVLKKIVECNVFELFYFQVGLNNIKETDFVNVSIQALMRVTPLRNFFLIPENYKHCKSPLVQRFGELTRKIWHARNFKGQVYIWICFMFCRYNKKLPLVKAVY